MELKYIGRVKLDHITFGEYAGFEHFLGSSNVHNIVH